MLTKPELKHLGDFVKEAITEKENMPAIWGLKDGMAAILFYQNASDEIREAIDSLFLDLTAKHFGTLIQLYLKSVSEEEDYSKKYREVTLLARQTLKDESKT